MKKILSLITLAAFALIITPGCSDFGDTNIDPEHLSEKTMQYDLLFSTTQVQALGSDWDVWRTGIIYCSTMMQHTTSLNWNTVFYTYNETFNAAYWEAVSSGDRGVLRDITDVVKEWESVEGKENDYQLARIMRAYIFLRMTDLYGDIPYSEAMRLKEGITSPKYDTQEFVYNELQKEFNEAQAAINVSAGSKLGSADLYFNGDLNKWKKFANSLILRMGMRLSKVNEAKAKEWVKVAVSNGLINQPGDNAILFHTDGKPGNDSAEPYGKVLSELEPAGFFLCNYFVDMLKNTGDPRLALVATVCSDPKISYSSSKHQKGNTDPAIQVGMPTGYDLNGGKWDISKAPGYPGIEYASHYSVTNRYTYSDPQAPTMIVTYAENQLLLAEAAYRGWLQGTSESKTAKEYYESGVRAAMEQFSFYPNAKSLYDKYITSSAIANYLTANPYNESRALEMINTQYYITTFCDEYETFANWRRSGFPALTPVNKDYPGCATNGTIPRRFTYPVSESQTNQANYSEAVKRLGNGDKMTSRVWWDVP